MSSLSVRAERELGSPAAWMQEAAFKSLRLGLRPFQILTMSPVALFLAALAAMLLRHPDVPFF